MCQPGLSCRGSSSRAVCAPQLCATSAKLEDLRPAFASVTSTSGSHASQPHSALALFLGSIQKCCAPQATHAHSILAVLWFYPRGAQSLLTHVTERHTTESQHQEWNPVVHRTHMSQKNFIPSFTGRIRPRNTPTSQVQPHHPFKSTPTS